MTVETQNATQTLVLLHGWGLNRAVWLQIIALIPTQISVITLDLPGYGLEANFPQPYSLKAIAAQLATQIPEQSFVLGWSLGGLVATQIALDFPHKVRSLAWVASSPCFLAQSNWPGMQANVLEKFSQMLQQNLPQTVERFLAIQAMGSPHARQDVKMLRESVVRMPMPAEAALTGGLQLLASEDLRPQLSQLTMPVAGCFGRLDSLVPAALIQPLSELLPKAQLTLLAKSSHAPFISHPEEFLDWLIRWLEYYRP